MTTKTLTASPKITVPPDDSRLPCQTRLVSVLIAAWNEQNLIGRCLDRLLELADLDIEIIVGAGGTDDTLALAERYRSQGVTVLEQKAGWGKQRTLAECFRHSTGQYIFLTDADCLVSREGLMACLAPLLDGSEQVTTGGYRPLPEQLANPFVQYQYCNLAVSQAATAEYSNGLCGGNTALCRSALLATGGFTVGTHSGTDYLLAHQLRALGYQIRYVPQSQVETWFEEKPAAYVRQRSRWLLNLLVLGYRHNRPEHYRPALVAVGLGQLIGLAGVVGLALVGWGRRPGLAGSLLTLWAGLEGYGLYAKLGYRRNYRHLAGELTLPRLFLYQNLDFWVWFSSGWRLLAGRGRWQW